MSQYNYQMKEDQLENLKKVIILYYYSATM